MLAQDKWSSSSFLWLEVNQKIKTFLCNKSSRVTSINFFVNLFDLYKYIQIIVFVFNDCIFCLAES